jgi:hypothetical protein
VLMKPPPSHAKFVLSVISRDGKATVRKALEAARRYHLTFELIEGSSLLHASAMGARVFVFEHARREDDLDVAIGRFLPGIFDDEIPEAPEEWIPPFGDDDEGKDS